jgi:DNA-binding MarR family transcriptional regulator
LTYNTVGCDDNFEKLLPEVTTSHQYVFGSIFLLSNKLQVLGDQYLAVDGITLRQWFLTVIIKQFGPQKGPTLTEAARLMGTSHQNVKQIALKLVEKKFLVLEKNDHDGRSTRLKLTEKSNAFWDSKSAELELFLKRLFSETSHDQVESAEELFKKLLINIDNWDAR